MPWLTTVPICSVAVTSRGSGRLVPRPSRSGPAPAHLTSRRFVWTNRLIQKLLRRHTLCLFFTIILPAVLFLMFRIQHVLHKGKKDKKDWIWFANELGKSAAYVSVMATAYFMIPVARFSLILEALGIGNAEAVQAHIWAGHLAITGIAVHGLTTLAHWIANEIPKQGLRDLLVPAIACFRTSIYLQMCQRDSGDDTDSNDLAKNDINTDECVSHDCFLGIGFSSMNIVRRKAYTIFYIVHAGLAVLALVFSILHWDQTFTYLLPSLILWLSTSLPVCVETHLAPSVLVTKIESIPAEKPCVSITFKVSPSFQTKFLPGHYVLLGSNEISFIMHPLTLCHVQDSPHEYRVIARCVGPFTSKLLQSLISNKDKPDIKIQGPYGSTTQVTDVLRHDRVMIIAGGIGITTYISLLAALQSIDGDHENAIQLHWICRDRLLVEFIEREYLSHLRPRQLGIDIFVHMTNQGNGIKDSIEVYSVVQEKRVRNLEIGKRNREHVRWNMEHGI